MLLELSKFRSPDVNWSRIMYDLRGAGITYEQMEVVCEEYHGWYERILKGQKPKHRSGEILLAMHSAYCQRPGG